MAVLRRFGLVLVVLAALAGAMSTRALAIPLPSCTPALPQTISSAHFLVSYSDDPLVTGHITQVQAGTVLAAAERSYASYVDSGFPVPAVGGSGKTELYIMDLKPFNLSAMYCNGSVVEDAATVTGSSMPYSVGSDVFTQVTSGIGNGPQWLVNGTATWASWRALGYPAESIGDLGPFDMALDCDSAFDKTNCSATPYENLGASRWPFYEFLTERFGPLFIVDIFTASQAAGGDGLLGLQNALTAKGTTLTAEYGAYAAKLLTGGWTATTLSTAVIPVSGTHIQTGISSGAIPTQSFGVNHLATKYVEIDRGDGSGDHACYLASLTLNVKIPAGVTSQPTFYWSGGGSAPVALTVANNVATTTVPWDTCAWTTKGYLALPNTSLVDGTSFVVSGTLTVNFLTPVTSALPPAQTSQFGPVIDAATFSSAPLLSLFGPQLLHLAANDDNLRLIVQSSGEGSVSVAIGAVALGSRPLRPGGNDLRFPLPAGLLNRSLSTSTSGLVLTLTPLALDGTTAGATLTKNVIVEAAPKPAAKVPAKKAPAKKSPTKKTPTKKAPAKKTPAKKG
jgi:hypothetical protein